MPDYPQSIDGLIDANMVFPAAVMEAVEAFAGSKPWRGDLETRRMKFQKLNADLATATGVTSPTLTFSGNDHGDSGNSCYSRELNVIGLDGKLSVITFLHEWGHVIHGSSEVDACRWSLNLFQRCFPWSWARLRFEGHMARRL